MRTSLASLILAILFISPVHAAQDQHFMRDLTIETMMVYAKELYQRGDIKEARAVMARIKQLGGDMPEPKQAKKVKKPAMTCCTVPVEAKKKPAEVKAVVYDPNADLKQAIAHEEQILVELNRDVDSLRNQIQATRHE